MSSKAFRHLLLSLFLAMTGLSSVFAQNTVTVNNTACPAATVTFGAGTIAINTANCIGSSNTAPVISSATPPSGTVGSAYSYSFGASGNPTPTWSITAGTQPAGLSLSSAGVLSGTPNTASSYTFTVQAANGVGANATQQVTVQINPPSGPPVITSAAPPAPALNVPYSFTFTATGAQPITWSAPSRPAWATLDPNTGVLQGTPTAGSTTFTVTATNSVSSANQSVTLAVVAPTAPTITSGIPPATGTVNVAYSFPFTATGTGTMNWTVASGSLPTGLSLNPSTGVLSGTPTAAATYTFTVQAANGTLPNAVAPAVGSFSVTIGVGSSFTKDTSGVDIPVPSKFAGIRPSPHSGSTNGAGSLYAYPVNPARCDNTTPAITSSWHHNIDFTNHRNQGQIDFFDMGVNESITYEFTPTSADIADGIISIGTTTQYPLPANFISISTKPCDFNLSKLVNGPGRDLCYATAPVDNSLYYTVTNSNANTGTCKLTPGTKYYFNLRWQNGAPGANNTADSCAAIGYSRCGLYVQIR